MSDDENARILRKALHRVWNEGDAKAIEKFYHPDFRAHYGGDLELCYDQIAEDLKSCKEAFPDFHEECHDLICDGDQVVARLTLSGTERNEDPSTAKSFSISSIDIYRFFEGRIIEQWGLSDSEKMKEQLSRSGD